ncbi:sex determination protein fruitless-like [Oppia nitens]|uniref:sex determination protein fruitless-like n=1 Tax=Oppia nitens TaxID=1686743 RepID=UPI0023DB7B31|nr:sex determination protein fruitless-like [Oppia nitens]
MALNQPQYRLKWNSFNQNLSEVFQNMLIHENLCDCTIACDGASIKAHKMVLAASSPYFYNLFVANPCKHPIVILKDVIFADLKSIIDFIYTGEVNVPQDQLSSLLKTAETLRIKGLTEVRDKQDSSPIRSGGSNSSVGVKGQETVQSMIARNRRRKRKANPSINHYNNNNNNDSNQSVKLSDNLDISGNLTSDEELVISGSQSLLAVTGANRNNNNNNNNNINISGNTVKAGVNYSNYRNKQFKVQKFSPKINEITVKVENRDSLCMDDIEPIKLLEQSMSTPEDTGVEYSGANDSDSSKAIVPIDLQEDDDDDDNELQEISLSDENLDQNDQQIVNDWPEIDSTQIGRFRPYSSSSFTTPQTIEEYERLLAQIQANNMTTCPVCCKTFLKKSKLIRHYHTHFSNFRPKFSCGSCGKLFTTQDWCKRHAISCQTKVTVDNNNSNTGSTGMAYD